jgi:hypothetical protein
MDAPIFSPWTSWGGRNEIEGARRHRVYLLARFDSEVPADASPLDPAVFLIAETHDQDLRGRWSQFHQTAFHAKDGHYGGWNFRQDFGLAMDREEIDVPAWLYVSGAPLSDEATGAQIKAVKAKLLENFKAAHSRRPRCNRTG